MTHFLHLILTRFGLMSIKIEKLDNKILWTNGKLPYLNLIKKMFFRDTKTPLKKEVFLWFLYIYRFCQMKKLTIRYFYFLSLTNVWQLAGAIVCF